MVAGGGGRNAGGPFPRLSRRLGLPELVEIMSPVEPQRLGWFQAVNRLGPLQEVERLAQRRGVLGRQADTGPGQEEQQLARVFGQAAAFVGRQSSPVRVLAPT